MEKFDSSSKCKVMNKNRGLYIPQGLSSLMGVTLGLPRQEGITTAMEK
jgi:hypothetical protein